MNLTIEQTLKELDEWSNIYDIATYQSKELKRITIFKGSVELVDITVDSIGEGYKLALEYIKRVNPNHELNRNNVEVS